MELFSRFLRILALAGGVVLLVLMLFTDLDIFLRFVFNNPFSGSVEFTEYMMAAIVFLSIAYCGWTGGHISVDLLDRWLNRPSLRFLPAVMSFAGAALFAAIAWQSTRETITTIDQVSNMLQWPHYPFRFTVAFGSAVFALVMLIQGVQALRRAPGREDAQ
jgi:TRAP-type C4-dicarboxylate transport system permease small subunit